MKLSEVKQLAIGAISIDSFITKNTEEIQSYIFNIKNGKSSINIFVEDDATLSNQEIANILKLYLNNKLHEWDIEYIFRVVEMSEEKDDFVESIAFQLSDPYLGLEINVENIEALLNSINLKIDMGKISNQRKLNLRNSYKSVTQLASS